jgi:hypothetical protein
LLPGITNPAFQRFHLPVGLLERKMAQMLDSMAARNGLPTACREPCQPIRTCTSWSTDRPSGRPVGHSILHRSLRMPKTVSGDTTDIRRALRAQIVFPRHARLSSRFTLIGGTTNANTNARRIIELRTLHHTENTLPASQRRQRLAQA